MLVHRRTIRIEWGDCDPAGIVYFPRYLVFFDDGTSHLFETALGMTKFKFREAYDFLGFPMVELRTKFMVPSQFGDDVTIESTVTEFRRSSFDVHHRLLKDGKLAVEGFETRVWVGRHPEAADQIKAKPIPAEVIERFNRT
jgi:4-hydroxybenzoyl-CoA thioesterase